MIRLKDREASELSQLQLELRWTLQKRGEGHKLFLQVYSLASDEAELLFDMERWFPPATVVTDRVWSSHIIWHSGHRVGGHHLGFPTEVVEERLRDRMDPLRFTLGAAALEASFHCLIGQLEAVEPARLTGEIDPELQALVQAEDCVVVW